ncbi:hypothetical protein H4R99_004286 [Coemansia sp. RSA 1722]|nr:hypothetical protein LPJ57_002081 [Coemansia sp. RSA 486]KAJ2228760.1 hypothetical protein IWW45_006475 [Coemansia sp. RSA 485]KAJ2597976.1 hypothetical protein H4R99_004286 [Coemansia sp. RSA 1722]
MSFPNIPSYVLRYFWFAGIAEASRLLLTAANVEWTEENPEWPQEKAAQPFGRMPVLIEKGANKDGSDFVLSESKTIERYLARKYGFIPNDLMQAARQEEIRDQIADVVWEFFTPRLFEGESRERAVKKFKELFHRMLEVHSRILRENGNNGHFIGHKLSYVDIAGYSFIRTATLGANIIEPELSKYVVDNLTPEFKQLAKAIEAEPLLSAHVSKVPVLPLISP